MPCFTAFAKVGFCSAQGLPIGATAFSMGEDVRAAVPELPIAHYGLGNVHQKRHTSRQNADECGSYPSFTRVKGPGEIALDTTSRPD